MHKARAFLVVCAGLFLLALAYHLGARSAGAQSGSGIECAAAEDRYCSAVIGRQLYTIYPPDPMSITAMIPGAAPVVACGWGTVVLEDGDIYRCQMSGAGMPIGSWTFAGHFPASGPTPAQSISIGQLKAKYATPAGK